MSWIYLFTWLKNDDGRLVGVEVIEHEEPAAAPGDGSVNQYFWWSPARREDEQLEQWASASFEHHLAGTPFPIRHLCAAVPTIVIKRAGDRAEEQTIPPLPMVEKRQTATEAVDALADCWRGDQQLHVGGRVLVLTGVRTGEPRYGHDGKIASCPVVIEAEAFTLYALSEGAKP
jgi:hypothetical protein